MSTITKIKELQHEIETGFSNFDAETIEKLIDELGKIAKTEKYYSCLVAYHFYLGNYEAAFKVCTEGIDKFSFSSSLYFNLFNILFLKGDIINAIEALGFSYKYSRLDEEYEMINAKLLEVIEELGKQGTAPQLLTELVELYKKIINEVDSREYPLDCNAKSLVRKIRNVGTPYENVTNLYKETTFMDIDDNLRLLIKSERYIGKGGNNFDYQFKIKTTIPISILESRTKLEIAINGEKIALKNEVIYPNKFNYITFEPGHVEIKSNKKIFIGNPIPLKDEPKQKRLIVNLFVDGVSAAYLQNNNIEFLPKTKKSFKHYYENMNCYSTGDWTYPSIASVFTGLTTLNHGQYHPYYQYEFSKKHPSFINKLRDKGYFTTAITGCWRSNPEQGYGNSFDRFVFKNSIGEFGVNEILEEAVEHLEAFSDKNNYLWLGIPDLHDIPDRINKSLTGQINLDSHHRFSNPKGVTSVMTKHDESSAHRYKTELDRIDFYISRFLDYIKSKYDEEEVLIVIHSDHGQGYLTRNPKHHLNEERVKVPFIMLGSEFNKKSHELMSITDIYPTVFNLIGEKHNITNLEGKVLSDFGGTGREYVITETYHPERKYSVMIKDDQVQFYLETVDNVNEKGLVDIEQYMTDIVPLNAELNDSDLYRLKDKYLNIALSRILHLQKS